MKKLRGRPPIHPDLKKKSRHVKLPRWLNRWLGEQDTSAAVLIEEALCEKHGLKPPTL